MQLTRPQIWLLLSIETVFMAALAAWVLWQFERLFEPTSLLIALAIVIVGDIASALILQRYAPTRITIEPGEASLSIAEVVSGFDHSPTGEVLVKGERWRARLEGSVAVSPGDRVGIVARSGLTLRVKALDEGRPNDSSKSESTTR